MTITFTGEDESTSSFSSCFPVGLLNDSWLAAQPLSLTPSGGLSVAAATEKIYRPGQSLWFKFPVSPDGKVQVDVSSPPGTMITLHRDLLKTYQQLETPEDAAALAVDDLPGDYLPGGYLPGGYLPGGYLPGGYLPGGYLPGGYLPGGYLPAEYLRGGYLPGSYLPELYSGAIRRSLLAVSNTNEPGQSI